MHWLAGRLMEGPGILFGADSPPVMSLASFFNIILYYPMLACLSMLACCLLVCFFRGPGFKSHGLLLLREPAAAGLERELMQPREPVVLVTEFFSDLNHCLIQLLMDGVRADGQPVRFVCNCKFMFQSSTTMYCSAKCCLNQSRPARTVSQSSKRSAPIIVS